MGVVPFPIVSMFPRSDLWLVGGSQADIRFLTEFQTNPHDRGTDKTYVFQALEIRIIVDCKMPWSDSQARRLRVPSLIKLTLLAPSK